MLCKPIMFKRQNVSNTVRIIIIKMKEEKLEFINEFDRKLCDSFDKYPNSLTQSPFTSKTKTQEKKMERRMHNLNNALS